MTYTGHNFSLKTEFTKIVLTPDFALTEVIVDSPVYTGLLISVKQKYLSTLFAIHYYTVAQELILL